MNWFNMLLGVLIAAGAGYLLEPDMRLSLTGETPGRHKPVAKVEPPKAVEPEPQPATKPAPAPEPAVDPIPEPKTEPVVVPVPTPEPAVDPIPAEPKVEPKADPAPEPPVEPKAEETKPAETKTEDPKMEEKKAEDTKAQDGQEETVSGRVSDEQVVKAMQSSFHSGEIKEFASDKANAWKATGIQKVDGEMYQTGMVDYAAETIFGIKIVQAKALIQDGRVVKWVSPKSGMEIK